VIANTDSAAELERVIQRYNDAWNAHDLDAIVSMHAPDMTFENHTAGESAQGEQVRQHIAKIFETCPTSASRPAGSTPATAWSPRSGPRLPPTGTPCVAAIWWPPRSSL
jgi:hypothetical protein